ncbi:hypothetical protein Bca52824_018863 [Brassica carinata]|uniref:Trichome birefringence-like N-terminal domain-containing protein n=1 Tax=Brassica carinata TaxID=52824 RepID=A0A8X7VQQ9_BRACI|nr:hypothetical protein Bca52824_018863 [Brassica carinata]
MGLKDNAISYGSALVLSLLLLLLLLLHEAEGCDMFTGRWVKDSSYPLYDPSTCPFIRREFACKRNGRPDLDYPTFRWQPQDCKLARFNGVEFLEKNRGKKIMFVGDSLSLNQWQSLTCMLHSSVPNSPYNQTTQGTISTFTFQEYGVELKLDRNVYLVDIVREKIGRVLKLDSINDGHNWSEMDTLIFNTWHWWSRRGPSQPWDYIQIGTNVTKDMDRVAAFEIALGNWGKWVDTVVDTQKTKVYFQGISPSHYKGALWGEPTAKSCRTDRTTHGDNLPRRIANRSWSFEESTWENIETGDFVRHYNAFIASQRWPPFDLWSRRPNCQ